MPCELAIIGAGNMAEAIARSVTLRGVLRPEQIIAADVSPQRRELFEKSLSIQAVQSNAQVARQARTILLSVKPYQMKDVLGGLRGSLSPETLIISIAAGIRIDSIVAALDPTKPWRIIRAMPNTPMLIGEGMVAIAAGKNATVQDMAWVRKLFESAAKVIEVSEDKIDAVTALSGSGPAYFYFLVEQMIQAGIEMGLGPEQAHKLATQTALGAVKLMLASSDPPAELRKKVTTPGGTTHAAISHLEKNNWPQITRDALKAAEKRSREMSTGG